MDIKNNVSKTINFQQEKAAMTPASAELSFSDLKKSMQKGPPASLDGLKEILDANPTPSGLIREIKG